MRVGAVASSLPPSGPFLKLTKAVFHFHFHFPLRIAPRLPSASQNPKCFVAVLQSKRLNQKKRKKNGKCEGLRCDCASSANGSGTEAYDDDFIVVNFYKFVFISDPQGEVSRHLSFLQGLDIHGRIYLNEQGINAQYSGPSKVAHAYVEWLRDDHKFSDVFVQVSPALNGHAFPGLRLRYKPSLVQLEGGTSHLPLLDPSMQATPLAATEWRKRLETVPKNDDASNGTMNYVLLDVRNGYEWDIGHFQGAQRPDVECFRSTSFGLSESQAIAPDPLAHVNKEETDILMYCTGGIRCDVYSAILRCCAKCVNELRGCCCLDCTAAPRLRPVLPSNQRYGRWHIYRDMHL
ncbi:rhodanese-like domain-containing protein 8, chloroplastic isoform X2 [Malania oleifera]|uniref:rhodanese-like domain-containing protein 8, chloroplastic isoform X2 n=1 Tax=Malania oleifera TaxID=397392 RepID=UPI0025AE7E11|nr:rhodanese-like domain-containing protein 8, chloroplastic isoform X2 [Malania oleifera]